jgi:GNAT superfamily N-acetyltransferase
VRVAPDEPAFQPPGDAESADAPRLEWLFESHLLRQVERHPELVEEVRSSFRFVIEGEGGGIWLVDLRAEPARVVPGGSGGLGTLTTSAATLTGIARQRVNPRQAWEEGLLRTEGDLEPAMLPALLHLLQIQSVEVVSRPEPLLPQGAAGGSLGVATARERPDLLLFANTIVADVWPAFMLNTPVASRYWQEMYTAFPDFQFVLFDRVSEEVVAVSTSAPLFWCVVAFGWPVGGWYWALPRAIADHAAGRTPTAHCGLMISIAPKYQGKGLSTSMIQAMRAISQRHHLGDLILPVRPSLKSRYPLTPIERYIHWRRHDGRPFDPWIRAHTSMGAEMIGACSRSTLVEGSVREWETWAKMEFPESGSYVVPGALVPVEIDLALDRGIYLEPNVWVHHSMK